MGQYKVRVILYMEYGLLHLSLRHMHGGALLIHYCRGVDNCKGMVVHVWRAKRAEKFLGLINYS